MPRTYFDLGKLLTPVGEETFFREYWEKQPLLLSRDEPDHYAGLLSRADVDQVIAFTRPKFPDGGAFSAKVPRHHSFVQGWLADRPLPDSVRFPDITELQRVYEQGKTVVIMTMQQRWLPIAVLCRNLEGVFHCPVHANMYLTPQGAQGFDAHFDTHEVLVLQLEGHKNWRLYGSGRALPLVDERLDLPRDQFGPVREVRLEAGDLLYLPRGYIHEAFTSECASLHLTVGVNIFRWADLFHEALAALTREDERFRQGLPPGVLTGKDLPGVMKERFGELLEVLAQRARSEDALRGLADRFFESMHALPGNHFAPPEECDSIDLDTVLEKNPGTLCRVLSDGGWVAIEFPGGQVGGPIKIATALHFVAGAKRFAVRDLPELGDEGKRILARRLVRERLLRVATRSAPATRSAAETLHPAVIGK